MKKLSLSLLLLLISGLMPVKGEVDIPQPVDLSLVVEKRLLKAVEAAQDAVRNSPDDAERWGQLGHVYLSHRWEAPAIMCYRQANTLAPDEFRWLYFLGRLATRHEPKAAVKRLTRALALNPEYAPAHLYLAAALRILGRFDEARQHLEQAKRLQPKNPFSELWLAEIAFAQRQVERARTHLENALRLNPRQSEAHALMAQVAVALGDKQTAKQHAQAARRPTKYSALSDPLWWDVLQAGVTAPLYAERGRRYMAESNYVKAVAEFEVLISRTQKDIDIWLDYAVALLHTERYSDALAALKHVQVLLRSDEDVQKQKKPPEIAYLQAQAYNHIAQIYYETGQTDAAILTGQRAVQAFHDGAKEDGIRDSERLVFLANVHANLAMAYEEIGLLEQAIGQYQKALELLPTKSALHRDLAGVYWKMRRYAEAESHYRIVIADDTTDVQAVYRLGLILLTKGEYEKAIARFEKVIELDNAHARAYEAMGIAYQEIGDISAAIAAFERVLRLEPDNKNVLKIRKALREGK